MSSNSQLVALGLVAGCLIWCFKDKLVRFITPKFFNITHFSCPLQIAEYVTSSRHLLPIQLRINAVVMSSLSPAFQNCIDVDQHMEEDMAPDDLGADVKTGLRQRRPCASATTVDAALPSVLELYTQDAFTWTDGASEQLKHSSPNAVSARPSLLPRWGALQGTRVDTRTRYTCSDRFLQSLYADTLRAEGLSVCPDVSVVEHPLIFLTLLRQVHVSLLVERLEHYRCTPYSSAEPAHVRMLARLWATLFPDEPFQPTGPRWADVGFQGVDPATDFRGGGVLSLHQLLAFARAHPHTAARYVALQRERGVSWFGFAVTGINLTVTLLALVAAHQLDSVFLRHGVGLAVFDRLFATALVDLADNWTALDAQRVRAGEPRVTQMDFPFLLKQTMEELIARARTGRLRLHSNMA